MDWNAFSQYTFYVILTVIAGAGEYIHLVPQGTLVGVLALVVGHFFGNGTTKATLNQLLAAMKISTIVPIESARIQVVPTTAPTPSEAQVEATTQGGNK